MSEGLVPSMVRTLAPQPTKVKAWVAAVKRENPELNRDELAVYLSRQIVRLFATQGAALSLPGAVPGLGSLLQVGVGASTVGVDLALMVRNQTYLTFALAYCYGIKGRELLIQDAIICMGLWTSALTMTKTGTIRLGSKVAQATFKKRFPASVLSAINKKVNTTIVTKYGLKRGGLALGRLIPFGVGVAVGGGMNYLTMKGFASSAREYFSLKRSRAGRKSVAVRRPRTRMANGRKRSPRR